MYRMTPLVHYCQLFFFFLCFPFFQFCVYNFLFLIFLFCYTKLLCGGCFTFFMWTNRIRIVEQLHFTMSAALQLNLMFMAFPFVNHYFILIVLFFFIFIYKMHCNWFDWENRQEIYIYTTFFLDIFLNIKIEIRLQFTQNLLGWVLS